MRRKIVHGTTELTWYTVEIGLRTLIRGPLEADVELLVKAVSGVAKNEVRPDYFQLLRRHC